MELAVAVDLLAQIGRCVEQDPMPAVAIDGNGRLGLSGHPDVALTRLPGDGIVAVPLWKPAARGSAQNQNPHVSPTVEI
jgi:hypothetical protein